jgi:quercetin dioxygenase-like cupin family protein
MTKDAFDTVEFDEVVALALAQAVASEDGPGPDVKARLMASIAGTGSTSEGDAAPGVPSGFEFRFSSEGGWRPHPVPGIRMKVLAMNAERGYATLLLDVAPGTRFPSHHHEGAEECYVISGSLVTCGRRLDAGDFVHADGNTDHDELFTEEGCRVLLIVTPEDYM